MHRIIAEVVEMGMRGERDENRRDSETVTI